MPVETGKPEDARRALALLNAAGARIGNSLDPSTTARELLDVAVPQFCDLAAVDLLPEVLDGDEITPPAPVAPSDRRGGVVLRRVAYASAVSDSRIPTQQHPATAHSHPAPVPVGADRRHPEDSPCCQALRTGRAQRPGAAPDSAPHPAPSEFGPLVHSTLAVPMVARDTVLGVVQFCRAKGSAQQLQQGGIIDAEMFVDISNVQIVCTACGKATRVGHRVEGDRKVRFCRKCETELP